MSERSSPKKYFLCGGFGGIFYVLGGHPMDTLKVRLQTTPLETPRNVAVYSGTIDCLKKTIRTEGIRGLYKGMFAPLIGVAPIFAISFYGFGFGKQLLKSDENEKLTRFEVFSAGAFSGIFTSPITVALERIKCLLQIQNVSCTSHKYSGIFDCAKKLYSEGGIRSIFKGGGATLLRDVPASGMYFMTYEWVKQIIEVNDASFIMKAAGTIGAGGCAGVAYWLMAMPADAVKTRLQTAPEGTFHSSKDVFKHIMKNQGPTAFFKGVVPVTISAFPANAACFVGFEFAVHILNDVAPNY